VKGFEMVEKEKKMCSVAQCEEEYKSRGFCEAHYLRLQQTGCLELYPEDAMEPVPKEHRYTYNTDVFLKEDQVSYYLLGAFMSDGHVRVEKRIYRGKEKTTTSESYSCHITSSDRDWLELINAHISPDKPVGERVRNGRHSYRVSYHNKRICQWLISQGCVPKKSLVLRFPKITDRENLIAFFRGMIDGDGTISLYRRFREDRQTWETSRICALYSSSKDFADAAVVALASLGIRAVNRLRHTKDRMIEDGRMILEENCAPSYRVVIPTGEEIYKFAKLIYPADITLTLPRKHIKAQEIIADWEREIKCVDCGEVLIVSKLQRTSQYCEPCREQHKQENSTKARKAYNERQAAKKNLA
jgi:LAGLIDADG-like domain